MSRGFRLVLGAALLAAVVGASVLWWPTETKRITRMIEKFAADASVKPSDGNFVRLAKLAAVGDRFTEDAQIRFQSLGIPLQEVSGREDIRQIVALTHRLTGGLDVKVFDIVVTLGAEPGTARADLTATATSGRQEAFTAQEFTLLLVKREGRWLIQRVDSVETLER